MKLLVLKKIEKIHINFSISEEFLIHHLVTKNIVVPGKLNIFYSLEFIANMYKSLNFSDLISFVFNLRERANHR